MPSLDELPPPLLEVSGIEKRYGASLVLGDVSLAIAPGEVRALCGENGAGKSTLVKIINGVVAPDAGLIRIDGVVREIQTPLDAQRLGIAFVSQELSLAPNLSVLDNIWLGNSTVPMLHRRHALRQRARIALDQVGLADLALDTQVTGLGIGQRQLVEVARMLTRNARILILDEPTATLSDVEIGFVFRALRLLSTQGKAIIYITHRLGEIAQICDSVTVLRNGTLVGTARLATLTRDEIMAMMLGREMTQLYPVAPRATEDGALVVRNLSVPGSVAALGFTASRGTVTCLAGQIGSGATEALRALAGLNPGATGFVAVHGRPYTLRSVHRARARDVRFVSEDRAGEGIFLRLSVAENLLACQLRQFSRGGVLARRTMAKQAVRLAKAVSIGANRLASQAGDLSGGNQQKLAFGRLLGSTRPGVLLLNEPTRGVDVGARAEIYRLIRDFCDAGWCIVMASSDLEEVLGLSDVILTLYRGQLVGRRTHETATMQSVLADITGRPIVA